MTQLLRLPEVKRLTGLSRSKIYELLSADSFPKPVKLGERTNVWPDNEVADWIDKKIAARV